MVFANADKDLKMIIVNCDCGCDEEIHIKKYVDNETPDDYYITISEGKFYSLQGGIFHRIGHRLKCIWRAFRGKEYLLCDINITEQQIDELIKNLEEIKK